MFIGFLLLPRGQGSNRGFLSDGCHARAAKEDDDICPLRLHVHTVRNSSQMGSNAVAMTRISLLTGRIRPKPEVGDPADQRSFKLVSFIH